MSVFLCRGWSLNEVRKGPALRVSGGWKPDPEKRSVLSRDPVSRGRVQLTLRRKAAKEVFTNPFRRGLASWRLSRDPVSRGGGRDSRKDAKPQRVVVNYTDLERLSVLAALRDPISRGEEYSSR